MLLGGVGRASADVAPGTLHVNDILSSTGQVLLQRDGRVVGDDLVLIGRYQNHPTPAGSLRRLLSGPPGLQEKRQTRRLPGTGVPGRPRGRHLHADPIADGPGRQDLDSAVGAGERSAATVSANNRDDGANVFRSLPAGARRNRWRHRTTRQWGWWRRWPGATASPAESPLRCGHRIDRSARRQFGRPPAPTFRIVNGMLMSASGETDESAVSHHPPVVGHREHRACAENMTVDGGHRRHGQRRHPVRTTIRRERRKAPSLSGVADPVEVQSVQQNLPVAVVTERHCGGLDDASSSSSAASMLSSHAGEAVLVAAEVQRPDRTVGGDRDHCLFLLDTDRRARAGYARRYGLVRR